MQKNNTNVNKIANKLLFDEYYLDQLIKLQLENLSNRTNCKRTPELFFIIRIIF